MDKCNIWIEDEMDMCDLQLARDPMQNNFVLTSSRLRSLNGNGAIYAFFLALDDTNLVQRFCLILQPSITDKLDPVTNALKGTVKDLQPSVGSLQATINRKDDEIQALKREVSDLHIRADDLEQHSRRASVRGFGGPRGHPWIDRWQTASSM